ncbi:MAG TPA: hypothetical protein VKQ07_00055 [Jatrophihabitantaceae bacterium]|nr:hypothetical protein [Jatrophihabitantaceae bacterium]
MTMLGPPSARDRRVSRRAVLVGTAAVVLGAGGGVAAGELRRLHPHHSGIPAPADLVAALSAEWTLIARVEYAVARGSVAHGAVAAIRADHGAHADALVAALRDYAPAQVPTAPVQTAPASRLQLRAAESAAATRAAAAAARLDGRVAVLLASIAASEASHAEVLA